VVFTCRVERCRVGERADRYAVLHVGRMRLRDDVERTRGVLMLMFMGSPGGVVGGRRWRLSSSSERGLLEGSEGRVESTAEGLGEGANVFGGGDSAECGHWWNWIGISNTGGEDGGPEAYLNVLATIG
jgi:hypothetical protein